MVPSNSRTKTGLQDSSGQKEKCPASVKKNRQKIQLLHQRGTGPRRGSLHLSASKCRHPGGEGEAWCRERWACGTAWVHQHRRAGRKAVRAMTALPYHGENKHIKDAGSFHAASSPAGTKISQPPAGQPRSQRLWRGERLHWGTNHTHATRKGTWA